MNERALIAFQYAKPEKREELAATLVKLATASRAEDGCLQYELRQLTDDPNVFAFFERWASQDALDRHFNGKDFQAFWSKRMDYLQRDVEVKFLAAI